MQKYTGHVYLERLGNAVKIRPSCQIAKPANWSEDEITEELDEASLPTRVSSIDPPTGSADLYVSWSPVYQVPTIYFRVRDAG